MLLLAVKDKDSGVGGQLSGTGNIKLDGSPILGAVNISADGTNNATIIVRENDSAGDIVFHQVTKSPMYVAAPMKATEIIYYDVSGTGATCQFFQWQE